MDEIDSKALEDCIRKTLRDYRQSEVADEDGNGYPLVDALTLDGHGIDMGEREIDNIVSELMYVITSKLAALEDENKTLRELVDEASAILARLERDYCSDFTLYDGRPVSDWCAKVAALSKPATLPAEGKGESEDFQDGWDAHELHIAMHSEPYQIAFPTMLRKMWSGTEVQAWLDKLPPLYELPATPPAPQPVGDDEAYEIGKRDGYEEAIQDLDLATGGDGEFKGSSFVEDTVDVPVMKQRIIDRLTAPQPVGEVRGTRLSINGLSLENVRNLLSLYGGEETDMTVEFIKEGHSGPGFYAWCTEYPEDGTDYLGPASEYSTLSAGRLALQESPDAQS